ncbi:MAG: hypothetical protein WA323_15870 [Candidatus Nitrosopolaris sp.]
MKKIKIAKEIGNDKAMCHKKILGSPKLGLGKAQLLSNIGGSRI